VASSWTAQRSGPILSNHGRIPNRIEPEGKEVAHKNRVVADLLQRLDLGSSVAESDTLLEIARVETSAFTDLFQDRIDLVPGTKGSGKSALFRMFVEFLPQFLLSQRKVVVAHGVQAPGDPVFHAFSDKFETLDEDDFSSFWCIYLISLAHEQFIKNEFYERHLHNATSEIQTFRRACVNAGIPEIKAKKSLRDILGWSLRVLKSWKPKLTYTFPEDAGALELDLFGKPIEDSSAQGSASAEDALPRYVNDIQTSLDALLKKADLSLWLMVDRLDEIFPRRSEIEKRALRGLLRSMRFFATGNIRVKVFLRDDMLDHVVRGEDGFTALTHVTVRQADTLRWTNEQILAMVVKRIFANPSIAEYLTVDITRLDASADYRRESFKKVFPPTVFRGPKQSATLDWICNRCADGRGVVTPRDVLDLLIRAKQRQQDLCSADPDGETDLIIGSVAIQYGFDELSKRKRQTYLEAEFPHLWQHMKRFIGGKTDYNEGALRTLLGSAWESIADDLAAIGFFSKRRGSQGQHYSIPFLYRHGLNLTQGKA
jgi:hypothetical protein